MLAVLLAVGVRNRVQAGEWVMTMSSSGANFYLSNHRGAEADARNPPAFLRNDPRFLEADFRAEAERLSGRKLNASQTSRFWFDRTLGEIAAAPLPAAWRFLRRLGIAWGAYEIANNYELAYLRGLTPSTSSHCPASSGWSVSPPWARACAGPAAASFSSCTPWGASTCCPSVCSSRPRACASTWSPSIRWPSKRPAGWPPPCAPAVSHRPPPPLPPPWA